MYVCANSNVGVVSEPIVARRCSKSLDGGTTWAHTSTLFTKPVPRHRECGGNAEDFGALDGNYPQPAPDGSLYVMVTCGHTTFLAKSTDESATWPIMRTGDGRPLEIPAAPRESPADLYHHNELRTDSRNNLYLMQQAGDELVLQLSRDEGRTWSRALDVVAPGVAAVGKWNVTVREPGHVAVSYLGHGEGKTEWDGYLTETRNALMVFSRRGRPVFWSARLNDPSRPLMYGEETMGVAMVNVDFIGVDIGPDGTPWASFVEDCGPGPDDPRCRAQHHQTRGFAGRFLRNRPG